jgi:hypothetical protein
MPFGKEIDTFHQHTHLFFLQKKQRGKSIQAKTQRQRSIPSKKTMSSPCPERPAPCPRPDTPFPNAAGAKVNTQANTTKTSPRATSRPRRPTPVPYPPRRKQRVPLPAGVSRPGDGVRCRPHHPGSYDTPPGGDTTQPTPSFPPQPRENWPIPPRPNPRPFPPLPDPPPLPNRLTR